MCARFRNVITRDQSSQSKYMRRFFVRNFNAKDFYWIDAPHPRQAVIEAAAKAWDRPEHECMNTVDTDFKEIHARFSCSPFEVSVDYPTLRRLAIIYPSLLSVPKW